MKSSTCSPQLEEGLCVTAKSLCSQKYIKKKWGICLSRDPGKVSSGFLAEVTKPRPVGRMFPQLRGWGRDSLVPGSLLGWESWRPCSWGAPNMASLHLCLCFLSAGEHFLQLPSTQNRLLCWRRRRHGRKGECWGPVSFRQLCFSRRAYLAFFGILITVSRSKMPRAKSWGREASRRLLKPLI